MKFLHTADWHLGKLFFERSIEEDQAYFLQQLIKLLKQEDYDALVISGDIYDRAIPPASACVMLDTFLTELCTQFPQLHVFIISGNHDSPERLSYGKHFFEQHNLHVCTDCKNITVPTIIKDVAFYQLPYLTPGCIQAEGEGLFETKLRSQQDLHEEAIKRIVQSHKKKYPSLSCVLNAHLFAAGSNIGESERSSVGNSDQVDAKIFSFFTYTALGHIHSAQKAGKNAWYAGSPLSYSFDERSFQKQVLSVTIEDKTVSVEKKDITPLHAVTTITASFDDMLKSKDFTAYENDFLRAISTDSRTIVNPVQLLRTRFPNILSFSYEQIQSESKATSLEERRKLISKNSKKDTAEIFRAFLKDLYGEESVRENELRQKEIELYEKFAKDVEADE
ncbi:MAG TPA: hypothetical protein DCQ43_06035 [Treponema sp.]|nr:hypothetical protein [Treponema sp.]